MTRMIGRYKKVVFKDGSELNPGDVYLNRGSLHIVFRKCDPDYGRGFDMQRRTRTDFRHNDLLEMVVNPTLTWKQE